MTNPVDELYSVAHQFNPEALRIAREFRGLRRKELAERVSLTPSAITQFEGGKTRPNAQTVGRMSMALGFPPSFFAQWNRLQVLSSDQCHFRSLRSCSQTERRKMLSAGSIIDRLVEYVDAQVSLPDEQVTSCMGIAIETPEQIEDAASRVRREWGLGMGPISNVVHLLESKGVLVFRLLEDCTRLDAFSLWHQGRPFIFVNTGKESPSRNRFDASHELGHLVMHPDYSPGDQKQEAQANRFASAFLLPRDAFLREYPRRLVWDHLLELKRRWKVSLAALARRAKDLGIISEDTYRRANVQIGKRGWKTAEPDEPGVEWPTVLPQAFGLLSKQEGSISAVAQHLSLFESDLRLLSYADSPDDLIESMHSVADQPSVS
jgi:Zn-dependent peptidase ImmA (M78 family)/transcriptional regulator with XRE-family HTH domain